MVTGMKRSVMLAVLVLALAAAVPAVRAQNVSFNATITGEVAPGVYGQVVLGNRPPPPLVYAQPYIVEPAPVVIGVPPPQPIYLHVPPGHAKHWRKHCHEYHACDRPVYFVRSAEYEPGYRPERHEDHGRHDEEHGDHRHHDDDGGHDHEHHD
jgi:hypothetical protein